MSSWQELLCFLFLFYQGVLNAVGTLVTRSAVSLLRSIANLECFVDASCQTNPAKHVTPVTQLCA